MIQRKQTLYLLAALIVTIVCLCLPIASLKASGMEPDSIVDTQQRRDFILRKSTFCAVVADLSAHIVGYFQVSSAFVSGKVVCD